VVVGQGFVKLRRMIWVDAGRVGRKNDGMLFILIGATPAAAVGCGDGLFDWRVRICGVSLGEAVAGRCSGAVFVGEPGGV